VLGLLALTALAAAIVAGAVAGEKASARPGLRGRVSGCLRRAVPWTERLASGPSDGWTRLSLFALLGFDGGAPRLAARAAMGAGGHGAEHGRGRIGRRRLDLAPRGGLAREPRKASPSCQPDSPVAPGVAAFGRRRAATIGRRYAIDPAQAAAQPSPGILASARDDAATAVSHLEASFEARARVMADRERRSAWPTSGQGGRRMRSCCFARSAHDDEMVRELDTWSWWQEQRGPTAGMHSWRRRSATDSARARSAPPAWRCSSDRPNPEARLR
jgi:hypothetical protein